MNSAPNLLSARKGLSAEVCRQGVNKQSGGARGRASATVDVQEVLT